MGIVKGDFGMSTTTRGPVSNLLEERLWNTTVLAGLTAAIAVPIAVLLGVFMALYAGTLAERLMSTVVMGFAAVPEFLVATVAVALFAVQLKWLPAVSYITPGMSLRSLSFAMVLPILTLVLHITAQIARMTKSTIANILTLPFIEMADLKGVSARRKVLVHACPNMAGPLANVVALNIAYLVSGVVVVETVFAYPGLARLMIDAVNGRDMPVIQACAMIFSSVYILLILIADVSAATANPRLRRTTRA
jgi:peptide/nickel transport system permease protein